MSQHDRMFRKSSFGGFNKQDVAAYLRSVTREHNEETEALRGVADKLRAECNTYKRQLDERQQAQEEIALRNASLSETLAGKDDELEALRRQAAEDAAEAERAHAENARCQHELNTLTDEARGLLERVTAAEERSERSAARMQALENRVAELLSEEAELLKARRDLAEGRAQMTALAEKVGTQDARLKQYEELFRSIEIEVGSVTDFKIRLAEVEQAARRKAETIEAEARRAAELANEALRKDAAEIKTRLLSLRREAAAAAAAAAGELEKARTQLEYVDAVFGGLDERMDGIIGGSAGPVIRDFVPEEFN
ncbi:MAG: hypothetical protein FWG93_03420 [Oscillospiraceae bacterium]|nr:hypothetical protein [Oscillospiraceae bacterium]